MADALIDDLYGHLHAIRDHEDELRVLADAFSITGNAKMAGRLYDIADGLKAAVGGIRNNRADGIKERLHEAQESSGALLKAVLAGVFKSPTAQDAP